MCIRCNISLSPISLSHIHKSSIYITSNETNEDQCTVTPGERYDKQCKSCFVSMLPSLLHHTVAFITFILKFLIKHSYWIQGINLIRILLLFLYPSYVKIEPLWICAASKWKNFQTLLYFIVTLYISIQIKGISKTGLDTIEKHTNISTGISNLIFK